MNPSSDLVSFEIRASKNGPSIGFARLNRARQLNAINLEMCQALLTKFREWASDQSIAAVVLEADGDKGFSAGGDVAYVVEQVRAGGPQRFVYGDSFFDVEYTLDKLIHTFPKPMITFSHGVCMGGGVGLTVGGSHRVVTHGSKIAMPEIHIGLFPDVGGGWFLNRVPGGIGRLMALTGLMINESDAVFAGLADYVVANESRDELWQALLAAPLSNDANNNREQVTLLMQQHHDRFRADAAASKLIEHFDLLRAISAQPTTASFLQALNEAAQTHDYLQTPAKSLQRGSPTTALIADEYLRRARQMSLSEVLQLDLIMARQFQRHHDFSEGVRALLIDKDRKPKWEAATLADVDPATVARHFNALAH